ncbi:ABC transporter substrate-binding protein [Marinobacter fuscus]|uniref:ABC transporter substrate-binding protein n=1 Tax=Marinobacter fuscus TaxID=2109942 RepID=UPI001F0CB0BF|nr:ABC transporter substrate-binding protein [Marinobacter fuscus]
MEWHRLTPRDLYARARSEPAFGRWLIPFLNWLLCLACLVGTPISALAEAPRPVVYVAGSGNSALDDHVTRLLRERLEETALLLPISEPPLSEITGASIVAIGPEAFEKVYQSRPGVPVLGLLVSRAFLAPYVEASPMQVSAVYYDVPLLRQALTGKAILPQAIRIALLATTETVGIYDALIETLPDYGMSARVFIADTPDQLIPGLIRALSYGDFILAGPDNTIYNPANIKHILLTAYRRNKILIGPNQAYVKAGSLASSYASFEAMSSQAVEYLEHFFRTGALPGPGYPDTFRVELNEQVARSLNIPMPSRERISNAVNALIEDRNPEGTP